jgi:hypothetical protein
VGSLSEWLGLRHTGETLTFEESLRYGRSLHLNFDETLDRGMGAACFFTNLLIFLPLLQFSTSLLFSWTSCWFYTSCWLYRKSFVVVWLLFFAIVAVFADIAAVLSEVRRSVRDTFAVLCFVLLPPSPGCLKTGAWVAFYNWSLSILLFPRLREKPHFHTYTLTHFITCMVRCWLLSQVQSSLPTDVMCIRVRWTQMCEHNLLICATWRSPSPFWFGRCKRGATRLHFRPQRSNCR